MLIKSCVNLEWRTVPGFSNYEVSESGHLRRSIHTNPRSRGWSQKAPGDLLSVSYSKLYPYVHIKSDKGKLHTKRLSQMVNLAFNGPCPSAKHFTLHKDDNPRNNHFSNLYWGTQKQNTEDKYHNGFCQTGELGPNSGFTNLTVEEIRRLRCETGQAYDKIAKQYGVAYSTIRNICIGKTYGAS